jgi:DNA-binding NarL/FixJ family response regulator
VRGGTLESTGLVIVDDHELLAQSLALAFAQQGIEPKVIAPQTDEQVLSEIIECRPAFVLLDLMLGAIGSSLPLIDAIVASGAEVVIMTGEENPILWAECFEAGASDVLSKSVAFDSLVDRITAIAAGNHSQSAIKRSELLSLLREHRRVEAVRSEPFTRLTAREAEVLSYLIEGLAAETIAELTFVGVATVRSHIRAILVKLGVNSQLAAVAAARRSGWNPINIGDN